MAGLRRERERGRGEGEVRPGWVGLEDQRLEWVGLREVAVAVGSGVS